MAVRLKTVEFAMTPTASVTDNTLTTLTQMTVYLPETGTKTFRSVVATVTAGLNQTAIATAVNINTRQLQCRLGAAAYTANTNANATSTADEDIFIFHSVNLTSHFTTNWTGTSMTFDAQVLFDSASANTPTWTNVCVTLSITYEYDDTSTTQIKTVRIPLDAPTGALGTTKPAAIATIPLLNTELPEASKVYRNAHIVVVGNTHNASATDLTLTMQLDATASHTSGTFEGVSSTDFGYRYVWPCTSVLNTTISMSFYIWANAAKFHHPQTWLVVTYEFDASSANDVFVSLLVPANGGAPGNPTASDFLRLRSPEIWIPEAGIVDKQQAFYAYWWTTGPSAGLAMRLGTSSFVGYTDLGAQMAGTNAAMIRLDSAFTIAQGSNTLTVDVYNTETTSDLMTAYQGFFIVNYTCDKPTGGHGAVNHTVRYQVDGSPTTGGHALQKIVAATAPVIPESDYYLNNVGILFNYWAQSSNNGFAGMVDVERLSGETGGQGWDNIFRYNSVADFRPGINWNWGDGTKDFKQFVGDVRVVPDTVRKDIETSRRWRMQQGQQTSFTGALDLWFTYHSQTWSVAGTVSGSAGGTVTLKLVKASTGEVVKTTTRTGNGSYSFTWYNNTETMYVDAYEDGTHLGRSASGVAT
jgi:hypothetical protein